MYPWIEPGIAQVDEYIHAHKDERIQKHQVLDDDDIALDHGRNHGPPETWYAKSLRQFNNAPAKLPFDHHELIALIAPRAVWMIESTQIARMGAEAARIDHAHCCKVAKLIATKAKRIERTSLNNGGHFHLLLA